MARAAARLVAPRADSRLDMLDRREVEMQFGLVLNWHMPVGDSASADFLGFDGVVEQIGLAEALGFTSVWPFEHDLVRGDGPAPWPRELMSKIAAATRTIRIGHRLRPTRGSAGSSLRAAEQAALLDMLCEGRLEIDCSASVVPAEAVDGGLGSECRWSATERALRMVLDAWASPVLGHNGAFFELPDYAAIAKPLQRPHPPLWMSVNKTSEWDLAGQLGLGVVVSAPPGTALQSRIDAYRHAVGRSGRGATAGDQIAVSTLAIGGSDVSAYKAARWPRRDRQPSGGLTAAAATRLARRTVIDQSAERRNDGDEALARTGLLIGDAERCIEAALAYARVGVNQLLCHFPVVGGTHAAITDAVTRFGQDVIPAFA
jgi:alkanesulfonate monooxygenase SsuD/methylene tetrahydromethanopterin reductase-like flavin-dependent oxidoreductase (luciferase family)